MKVLVLGNSDTRGEAAAGSSWAETAITRWRAARIEVDLTERRFAPIGARAVDIADRYLRETQPDSVFIPLGEYAFWAATVEVQIRHRFGARAGRMYKRLETAFEKLTAGRRRAPGAAYGSVRFVARRLIGVRALASVEEVTATYLAVFQRLAQAEALDVWVVAYPLTPLLARRPAALTLARTRFLEELHAAATARYFHWLDGDAAIARAGLSSEQAYATDNVHVSQLGRDALGRALGELIADRNEALPR